MRRKSFGIRTLVLAIAIVAIGAWNAPAVLGQDFIFSEEALPGGSLDPTAIPKFEDPLVIPPVMPPVSLKGKSSFYKVGMRQFQQKVLPGGFDLTTVWGYGPADDPTTERFHSPSYTIEARTNEKVQVDWVNQLMVGGGYLPHLLPVDPTLHWANPAGGDGGKDMRPEFMPGTETPGPYLGPVPTVAHLHGAHVADHSDGYPEAWFLPAADNIEEGYATKGTNYTTRDQADVSNANPGKALYEYSNDQRATTLWYHDHTLGMTRLNVYAGLAGFWLIRDDKEINLNLPGPAPKLGDPLWEPQTANDAPPYGEIPIVIQDRSFNEDGSLFYPDSREFFDEYAGPYVPANEIPPIWNPEFFGNTMMVNGRTWPYLNVEPKKYRFRLLNGCNSRFLVLNLKEEGQMGIGGASTLAFNQIGNDGGLLPGKPVVVEQMLLGPAERADVIVDFSGFAEGTEIIMYNYGPDEPFGGIPENPLDPDEEYFAAHPESTGQVMKFKIVPLKAKDKSSLPSKLPKIDPLPAHTMVRNLTLNEHAHDSDDFDGPVAAMLGTADLGPLMWTDLTYGITETPALGATEVWRVINLTEDAHPIHLHLVQFEILGRAPFDFEGYEAAEVGIEGHLNPTHFFYPNQELTPPEPGEMGAKDTVIVYPGEYIELKATFDLAGLYVWHCHILEHEDNEMMRPYRVLP